MLFSKFLKKDYVQITQIQGQNKFFQPQIVWTQKDN